MALIASILDPTGVSPMATAYLRWTGLSIEPLTRSIRVTFSVYRDRAAHDAGKRPVDPPLDYALTGPDFDTFLAAHADVAESIEKLVYDFAKVQPELAGATEAGN